MKNKLHFNLSLVLPLCALIMGFYMLAIAKDKTHLIMCTLPFSFSFMQLISGAYKKFFSFSLPGWSIVNILYLIKAVIYPFGVVVEDIRFALPELDVLTAIFFEAGEIIVIYSVFALKGKNNQPADTSEIAIIQNDFQHGKFILVVFLCFAVLIALATPGSLDTYNFINSASIGMEVSSTSSFVSITIDYGRIILLIVVLNTFYKKQREGRKAFFALSIVFVCFAAIVIKGVSRTSFVVPALCGSWLLFKLYPTKKKKTLLVVGGVLFSGFVLSSFTRFNMISLSDLINMNSFQSYFCCTKNMAVAICARREYANSINLNTFLSDLFGNWMGIGHAFRKYENISEYFNYIFHGHKYAVDQIVPTIGEAYMQFGYAGTYIYTIIMCNIIIRFDNKFKNCTKIEFSYLYVFTSIKCAITLMGNLKIFMATVLNYLIPLYIVFWINSRIVIRNNSSLKMRFAYDQFTKNRV